MFNATTRLLCNQCEKVTNQNLCTRYIFSSNHKYLVIRLHTANIINGKLVHLNSDIIDYDENKLSINANIPSNFKIVSAVVYSSASLSNESGHYVIWVRNQNNHGWLRISDTVSRSYPNLIRHLKNVYVLFLERL